MLSSSIALIAEELNTALESLQQKDVEKAVQSILSHERVFVGAAGRSGLMLKAFAMRLMQMGKTVYVIGETVTPAVREGDLVFLASASGATHSVLSYAETAKKIGADLFVVTAFEETPICLIHHADVILPCRSKDRDAGSKQMMGTLFEQTLLIFFDAVVGVLPVDPEIMRQRHANLE